MHTIGVDGVILGRSTESDIVYFEQIGRALAVRGNSYNKHREYEKKSIDELRNIAISRGINIRDDISKEEIINKLNSPVIIDLANNIEFIRELENNLQDRIKEYQKRSAPKSKRVIDPDDYLFDIDLENQELFDILSDLRERLYPDIWENNYNKALEYYEENGNLEVPASYKVNGKNLGQWISNQRSNFKQGKLSSYKQEKLTLIGMRWVSKNKNIIEEKKELCLSFGIDYDKYKKEIDKILYQELYSKLCFLKDNDLSYIEKDKLNKIFYMSSINMKVEYGYTLEELVLEYYIGSKKVKK